MDILKETEGAKTIAVSGHINPDGDAVGSSVGMALYLEKEMPGVRVDVFAEDFKESLRHHMPEVGRIRFDYQTDIKKYDVFICLDTASDRLGRAKPF